MSEFATSAAVDVQVSPSSLRDARSTIESELGDVQVDVTTTSSGGSGGSRMAGRERAMGRQLQSKTNEHLSGIDTHWTENIDLNRERNDLLRQLVDVTEKDAQTRGRGGGMGGGALGLAIGGIGLGSVLLGSLGSKISDAIPDLKPADIIDTVSVGVVDVIDSAASVGVGDVISTAASLTPAAVIASMAAVTVSDVIDSAAEVSAGDVIAEAASVVPTDLIAEAASMTPAAVIAEAATITVSSVISSAAEITPGDVISAAVELVPSDIISGTISASDIADRITDPDPSPDGGGDGGLDPKTIIGGGAAAGGAYAAARQIGKGGVGQIGKGSLGVTTPVITSDMAQNMAPEAPLPDGWNDEPRLKRRTNEDLLKDVLSGPAEWAPEPTAADDPEKWKTTPTVGPQNPGPIDLDNVETGGATVEQNNNIEINADTSDLRREVDKKIKGIEKDLNDIESALN